MLDFFFFFFYLHPFYPTYPYFLNLNFLFLFFIKHFPLPSFLVTWPPLVVAPLEMA